MYTVSLVYKNECVCKCVYIKSVEQFQPNLLHVSLTIQEQTLRG